MGNAKALAIQRSKMGPYTHMNQFLIVEARGFGTAEIAAFNWNEYIHEGKDVAYAPYDRGDRIAWLYVYHHSLDPVQN